jgi:hypothetical protein
LFAEQISQNKIIGIYFLHYSCCLFGFFCRIAMQEINNICQAQRRQISASLAIEANSKQEVKLRLAKNKNFVSGDLLKSIISSCRTGSSPRLGHTVCVFLLNICPVLDTANIFQHG